MGVKRLRVSIAVKKPPLLTFTPKSDRRADSPYPYMLARMAAGLTRVAVSGNVERRRKILSPKNGRRRAVVGA